MKSEYQEYCNKILDKLKENPKFELMLEFGKMLMRHIDTFTEEEMKRYNELKELLKN